MLDTTQATNETTTCWRNNLSYGDIVSFRFPVSEEQGAPEPKARPCLVLDIETISGEIFAVLAYGTSATSRSNCGYEIRVQRPETYPATGLHKPTRFVGARRIMVPLTHTGFVVSSATGSPVLGRLQGTAFKRMNAVRARTHADRDIAADRRSRRRRSTKRLPSGHSFEVEVRKSRRPGNPRSKRGGRLQ